MNEPMFASGMSLRDYFAGQALVRLADFPANEENPAPFNRATAAQAYALADAMIAARGER